MKTPTKPKIDPRVAIAVGTLGVSFSSIFVRLSQAPALVTATLRLICTVALMTPWVLAKHRDGLRALSRRDLALCALSGFFLAVHFLSWFASISRTSIAVAVALVSTDAIFTALGFALILKGKIPKLGIAAIAITFAGSVAIALGSGGVAGGQLSGALLSLAGAFFCACYLLIGRVQRQRLSTSVYTWLVYTTCMLVLLVFCAVSGTPLSGWGGREWLIGLAMAVVCTLLGHNMFSWSLGWLSPAYVAAAKLGEPVLASIMAVLLFREIPGPVQIVGAVVVLAGIFLYSLAEGKEAPRNKERPD